jgi:flagellar biogenesis protein FliO
MATFYHEGLKKNSKNLRLGLMHLKKLLPVLFLLSTSIACSATKQLYPAQGMADPPPPLTDQVAPTEPAQPSLIQPPAPSPPPEPTLEPSPAPLPSSKEMTNSYESAFVRMLVTLLGLAVLVFATFWILRRLGKGKFKSGSGRTINVIERRALSPKSMLYVVEIGNKKVLISESQIEVRTLTSFEELPEDTD